MLLSQDHHVDYELTTEQSTQQRNLQITVETRK